VERNAKGVILSQFYKIRNQATGAKATAWKWFAKYIKLRDAIATTGTKEAARCITCGNVYPLPGLEAGHMIPGRSGGILFDETIVYAQCHKCNGPGKGEVQMYKHIMVQQHGPEWYDLKLQARKTPTPLGEFECRLISDEYRKKYNALLKG